MDPFFWAYADCAVMMLLGLFVMGMIAWDWCTKTLLDTGTDQHDKQTT